MISEFIRHSVPCVRNRNTYFIIAHRSRHRYSATRSIVFDGVFHEIENNTIYQYIAAFYLTILTGLFSTSEGLFYGAGANFLGAQIFGAVLIGLWAIGMGFIIFKALDKIHGLRVPSRIEEEGLDIYEHGESAYN